MSLYDHYSGKLGLICFFIYLLFLFRYRKAYSGTMPNSRSYGFVMCAMILYSVLGFLQYDTYHYAWGYETMITDNVPHGVEDFYFWLIQVLPKSYLIWRFAVWGAAALLIIITAKRLNLNSEIFGLMIPLFFLTQLSATRDSLGFSLMMLSAVVFVQSLETKKILMIVLSVLCIWACFYLHKSMFIFISFLFLAYFLPINKKTIVFSLILFPVFYAIAISLSGRIASLDVFNDQQAEFMNRYMSLEAKEANTVGQITKFLEKSSLVLFVLLIVKRMLYDNIPTTKAQYLTFKYAYLMVYVSFLFLGQPTSIWISTRALHAGMFALVLCASHCFDLQYTGKRTYLEKVSILLMFVFPLWEQISFIIKNWT